jgi:hypothetical protein
MACCGSLRADAIVKGEIVVVRHRGQRQFHRELLKDAVTWMELQAMRRRLRFEG